MAETTENAVWFCEVSDPEFTEERRPIAYAFEADEGRLLAAAPELLEALRLVLPAAEHAYHTNAFSSVDGGDWWVQIENARAAIAKAEGTA